MGHGSGAAGSRYSVLRVGALVLAVSGAAGTALAADVDVTTSTDNGIVLDSFTGATVQVEAGVTVGNTTFTLNCSSFYGLCATTQAWTVTNLGTVDNGLSLTAGGDVINSGGISGGNSIWIDGGSSASVDNKLGGTISGAIVIGDNTGVAGTVTNAGTITSSYQAIGLWGGGTVTNLATGVIEGHGDANAVAVILGTSRIVDNYGLIQSNDFGYATGVSLQSGTLTNYVDARILGAYNAIWTYTGPSTITNYGYLEASKAEGGGSAIEVDAGGTIINSGTIKSFTSDATTSDAGISFSGAGSITNSGTIESTDGGLAISFNGGATHTLNLDTGSVLGGNVQGGTGSDNLALLGTGSEAISKFQSFETLSMQGIDWTLNGNGTFATSADIESGRLSVNGALTVPTLSVLSGGTLSGTGQILGAVSNSGTIAPGNSIGTLMASSVLFSPNSIFAVEIDPSSADKLVVTGTATINSTARVSVLPASGTYTNDQEYLILDAGTRNGTFGGIAENSAFLHFSLDYDKNPNEVWLDVTSVASFPEVAETHNQIATASGLDALGSGNPIFDALILLDADDARQAFDLASGEVHASVKANLLADSRFVREAIVDRLRQQFDAAFSPADPSLPTLAYADESGESSVDRLQITRSETAWSLWGQGFGSWGDYGGDGNAASLGRSVGGFVVGVDATVGDSWRLGIATGYQAAGLDIPDRASSASIEGYHLAAYGGYAQGPFALRLGGAYAWYDVDTERSIVFPGFADSPSASYGAHLAQAFGEIGYGLRAGTFAIEPFAGLAYVGLHANGFSETGGWAALTGASDDEDISYASLGARFGTSLPFGDGRAAAHGMVAWQHAFKDVTPGAILAFAGAPFAVAGIPIASDAVRLEAGLDWALSDRAAASLDYSGEIAVAVQDHGLKAKLLVRF